MAGGTEGRGQMTEELQTWGAVIGNLSAWEDAVPLTEIRNVRLGEVKNGHTSFVNLQEISFRRAIETIGKMGHVVKE